MLLAFRRQRRPAEESMHIPDGFINATTSLGAGLISVGGLSFALRRAKEFMEERRAPLAGLLAAFIFALQMLNFPVAAGTSGHFMGGLLAAVLVGPWVAVLVMAVVLAMQALLFADGGLTALGLNISNLALLAPLAGWIAFISVRKVLPAGRRSVVFASGVAAALSVLAAAFGFVVEYALGGTGSAAVGTVAGA
ncbi:MAG: energy-coupling factor ABC transporter permease, partial [Actinobacteria bacterium]|nr:energy-coupling factor ABC transporter permease [Actinomycetota bacterium]